MLIRDFLNVWYVINLNDLNVKYFYKGTECTLFQLRTKYINEALNKITVMPNAELITGDSITIDLSEHGELSYADEQLIEHINYIVPCGSFGIVLYLFIE